MSQEPDETGEELATRQDLVESADRLVEAINGFRAEAVAAREEATKATSSSTSNRKRTRLNFRLWIAEAVIAVGLAIVGITFGVNATNTANELKQAQYTSCLTTNDTRQKVSVVWHNFVDLLVRDVTDPQTKTEAAQFLRTVDATYASADCSKILK